MDSAVLDVKYLMLINGNFSMLVNDEDRVNFVAAGFVKYGFEMDRYPIEVKSSTASETFRNEGNKLFKSNPPTSSALESVLELYSKSVAYAPPGSRELSLAYANRSAVLFKANRHEECLLDIDRALCTGYPDELKPKLLIRRAKSTYALTGTMDTAVNNTLREARSLIERFPPEDKNRQAIENILNNPDSISSVGNFVKSSPKVHYVLELEKENPNLPGASDAIKLQYSEEYGVHVVAARDIKSGELLTLEKPYAVIVDSDAWYKLCAHCGKRSWNGIPCDHCVYVMYCSDECKRAAWSEYHDVECQILEPAIKLNYHSCMGLRLTVKALKEAGSFEKLKQHLNELDSLKERRSRAEVLIDPTSYSTIYVMSDNANRTLAEIMLHWSANAVELTYFLATRTEIFGGRLERNLKTIKDIEWFTFVAALMAKNMRISKIRTYEVHQTNSDGEVKQSIYVLIPVYTYLNHSCTSRISPFPLSGAIGVVTPVPIKAGDQIFTYYGPHFDDMKTEERRKFLKNGYQFVCNCDACKYDWSHSTYTSYENQGLSPEIVDKLHRILMTFAENVGKMSINEVVREYCICIDEVYSNVVHPCADVQFQVKAFYSLLNQLTETPMFMEDFEVK